MARIKYESKNFAPATKQAIEQADTICAEYADRGLTLTLRQLYYQFVARGLIANKQSEYKRLAGIMNDARMAGELDWDYLVDRTRNLASLPLWESPRQLIDAASKQFRMDLWKAQNQRVEVWIEKDAAIGVIENVCNENLVPYFSTRGYSSISEVWATAGRIVTALLNGERFTILHIGDHDPSGLDMTRDIEARLKKIIYKDWLTNRPSLPRPCTGTDILRDMQAVCGLPANVRPFQIKRIALTIEQIQQYQPPPNPAKTTDSRFERYMEETGLDESWELDALDPFVLETLIQDEIELVRDEARWAESNRLMERERATLGAVSEHWVDIKKEYAP